MKQTDINKTIAPWLGRTSKMVGIYIGEKFKEHRLDLTGEQWLVLKKLSIKDGQSQNDLAFCTERDKTSLTRLVTTMEKKELVSRMPSEEDKRVNHVYLTDTGKKVFESSIPIMNKVLEVLQNGISEEEIQTAIEIIKKVQLNIKNN